MKTLLPYIFILCLPIFFNGQVILKLSNDSLQGYSYLSGDEFNAPALNENYWSNGLPWSRVIVSQDLAFSQKNVNQKDGLVNFVALKADSIYVVQPHEVDSQYIKKNKITLTDNKFLAKYSVGCIVSRQKFHYGLYELRFKVEEGRGVWPAFWFFGGNKNEEIDCFELKCERNNEIHVDTHCPYGCDRGYKNKIGINTNWGGWMPVSNYLHNGFNIMQFEWKPDALIWYINGHPLAYFKGTFPNPMNLYLNTSCAKDGGAFKPGPDETTKWPNTYSVDYFRAWKPISAADPLYLNVNPESISSTKFISDYKNSPQKKGGLMYHKKKLSGLDGFISITLSSPEKLKILIMGELLELNSKVEIKGVFSGSITELKNTVDEQEIDLKPIDKQIQITVKVNQKEYTRIITLK